MLQIFIFSIGLNSNTLCHYAGSKGDPLEFAQRLNIAIDIVHAIAYLHGYTGTYPHSIYIWKLSHNWNIDAYDIHIWHNSRSAYLIMVLNVNISYIHSLDDTIRMEITISEPPWSEFCMTATQHIYVLSSDILNLQHPYVWQIFS